MLPGEDERSKWKSAILHNEGLKDWAVELTEEAEREPDPDRRRELDQTAIALWHAHRRLVRLGAHPSDK